MVFSLLVTSYKENMKIKIMKVIAFLLIFCALFAVTQEVVRYKTEQRDFLCYRYDAYLSEPENSIDILFLGSSPVYAGIAPAVIWRETGMTSINFGTSYIPAFISYYQLCFALETQKPSLVVMDFSSICQDKMADDELAEPYYRINIDALPDRKMRNDMILHIIKDNENQNILTYDIPLLQYHSRWNELWKGDFVNITAAEFKDYNKGALFRLDYPENEIIYDPEMFEEELEERPISEYSWGYYQKMLDLCSENDIPVAIVSFPKGTKDYLIQEYNTLERVCAENGLNYYNLNTPTMWEILEYDTETDFYDWGHTNAYGAVKVSKALAEMFQHDYSLPDHRNDVAYNSWNEDWNAFYLEYEDVLSAFGY